MPHDHELPTRVRLVRHGQSHASVQRIVAGGDNCAGLTDRGRGEAARLTVRLRLEHDPPGTLLTSPILRARQTAAVLADGLGLGEPLVEPGVRELDFGAADGLTTEEYAQVHGVFDITVHRDRPFAPGGESWSAFTGRARLVMDDLAARHRGDDVMVVCHAGFVVAATVGLLDVPPPALFSDTSPATTSISEFVHDGGEWSLVRYDDAAHLAEPSLEGSCGPAS
ncbi:histidine phosphatase family protein [Streptomyces sp. NPDC017979]|uniref:histidine phosphatase family protein n=1 Tax=Streptomyces sp. NPDC017979 TaxID=3365024 RepID=UPI0037A22C0F